MSDLREKLTTAADEATGEAREIADKVRTEGEAVVVQLRRIVRKAGAKAKRETARTAKNLKLVK